MDLSFDTFLDYDQALQDHFNKDDTDFFNLAAAYHDAPGHKSLLLKNLLHQAAMLLKKRGVEFTLSK